jgi:outer membrane protein assembly factor BamA
VVSFALLAALVLGDAGSAPAMTQARSAPLAEQTFRVGSIYIIGHEDMVTSLILAHLDFQTGDVVTYRKLHQAERRLAELGVFVVDPATGARPQILPEEAGRCVNLWVKVVETGKLSP